MPWACGLWGHFGTLRESWQKENSSQAQGVARVPAKYIGLHQEPTSPVPHSSTGSVALGSQKATPVSILIKGVWWLCSDWLVGLVEKDASLMYASKENGNSLEVPFHKQHGRYLEQFSLKIVQIWENWLEITPLVLSKKYFYTFHGSFLRCITSRALGNQVGTSPGKRQTAFESLELDATHLMMPMII